jgi:hypothetical protein
MDKLTTVEVETFTDKELVKVFNYVAKKLIRKTPKEAKKLAKLKKGEQLNWNHLIFLLNRYGFPMKLSFYFNEEEDRVTLAKRRINKRRLELGLRELPEIKPEED